jgi:uracil-DNA glycosylase
MSSSGISVNLQIGCKTFPCEDINKKHYLIPKINVNPEAVKLVLISEAAPPDPAYYYYAGKHAAFAQTTLEVFNQAGVDADSIQDLIDQGIYLTTAVKCGKTGYGIKAETIKTCSHILEKELNLFPNVGAYLLMGDVAIKAVNYISKRITGERVIPAGSTYKIRGGAFHFQGKPAFPSYLQVGPSFGIEKSKLRMIVEDIARAMNAISNQT